jgi:hypothetical protein
MAAGLSRRRRLRSTLIHHDAIGTASDPEDWYGRLNRAIAENVRELERLESFRAWYAGTRPFIVVDLGVVAILALAISQAT